MIGHARESEVEGMDEVEVRTENTDEPTSKVADHVEGEEVLIPNGPSENAVSAVDTDSPDENSDHAASTIPYSVKGSEPLNAHSVGSEDGSPLSHTLTMSDNL